MAKFENVLPALRAGKKVRRAGWSDKDLFLSLQPSSNQLALSNGINIIWCGSQLLEDDWEIVPEPKRVADYWVPFIRVEDGKPGTLAFRETLEVGKQPVGSVLIPGTEREETT